MSAFTDAVGKVASALIANADKFEKLDAAAGDGDLGITAKKIAGGMQAGAAACTGDLKQDLMLIGREIAKAAPSTFGTLFATGFIRASAAVTPDQSAISNLRSALTAAYEGIASRGKAALGERTLLDALHPAVQALEISNNISEALNAAAVAAHAGAISTTEMAPKHGRAGWIGDRAKGFEDAGASVISVAFESLKSN